MKVSVVVKRKSEKTDRMRNYIRDPIKPSFVAKVRDKLVQNVRSSDGRPLPFHTYPSDHAGQLESSCFATKTGKPGHFELGSYLSYARILEDGRKAQTAKGKRCFIFKGYYPNPRALRAALRAADSPKLSTPMAEFQQSARRSGKFAGERMKIGGKAYNPNLSPEKMKKQNVRFIEAKLKGDIIEMKWRPKERLTVGKGKKTITRLQEMKENIKRLNVPGAIPSEGKRALVPAKYQQMMEYARVKKALPFGVYTVYSKHTKAIQPYKVFSNTARWAREELINEVKRGVRRVNIGMTR